MFAAHALSTLLTHLAQEWGPAQSNALTALGLCPTPPGQLPSDYIMMAIGNRGGHHLVSPSAPAFAGSPDPVLQWSYLRGTGGVRLPHLLQVPLSSAARVAWLQPAARLERLWPVWARISSAGVPQPGDPG